jgi:uncharacterized membrane protein
MGFFEDYFLNPILQNGWFNPVNTIVYSIILITAVYFVFRLLFRMGIRIDRHFFYAVLPFIFWGSSTRVLHDAAFAGALSPALNEFYSSPLFPTPGSYLITFTLALAALLVSLGIQKKSGISYWKPMLLIGTGLSLANIWLIPWVSVNPLILIAGLTALWSGLFYGLSILFKADFFRKHHPTLRSLFSIPNQVVLGSHFLDASATFTALRFYGYLEQHVVPRLVFPFLGPISMFLLKIVVVVPVLWVIDSYAEDRNFRNFLKIVVLILGLAPGLRDLIRLMAGV